MSLLRSVKTFLTPSGSQASLHSSGFTTAKTETDLFPATDPKVDGDDCLRDCDACTTHYPNKFSIDESDKLYGHVKGWNTHLIVGTGKTDWVRDVTDEKGSVMQAVGRAGLERKNGKIMLSASNLPSGEECHGPDVEEGTSDCLLLPAWVVVEKVAPSQVDGLMREVVERSVTNSTRVGATKAIVNGNGYLPKAGKEEEADTRNGVEYDDEETPDVSALQIGGGAAAAAAGTANATSQPEQSESEHLQPPTPASPLNTIEPTTLPPTISSSFKTRPIPHSYLILMCSQKTRDARCGQSAPLLRKEFERILRPLGMYRDLHDDRPGGVGIYFISHVGGHKYSANVMIYRRAVTKKDEEDIDGARPALAPEAIQLIWLARVRPEDCENIVRYTILQGKVVKPQRQLRGGFDRERGVTSW